MKLGRSWLTGFRRGLVTEIDDPSQAPQAFIPEATKLAEAFADKVDGVASTVITETLMGVPSTAHILGGCPIGDAPSNGVIDTRNRVFGYDNLYVVDGSMIPSNLGVNPSLTITAMAEHAMSKVPKKADAPGFSPCDDADL